MLSACAIIVQELILIFPFFSAPLRLCASALTIKLEDVKISKLSNNAEAQRRRGAETQRKIERPVQA
jgi:hypothetical protein